MNLFKRLTLIFFVLLCLLPASLKAEVWTVDNLPMVHLQDSLRFVCNPDGIMSPAAVNATDKILADLKLKKGVETVVVVVKRIEGGDPYQFGMQLGRKYGVGNKMQRSGLIIILSTEDRKYQFLTGNGLEGTLPDAICRRIQNRVMVPALKQGDWDAAIYQSVKAIEGYVLNDATLKRHFEKKGNDDWVMGIVVFIAMLTIFLIFYKVSNPAHKNCPKCKSKGTLTIVKTRRIRTGNQWYNETMWRCSHCGHTVIKVSDEPPFNNGGGFIPPIIIGGHRGGFGGGDGFSGGSFGGGSFGGGGSGGDF